MENRKILKPGEKVRNIRRKLRISQSELAVGDISKRAISYIECGMTGLTFDMARKLSDSLNRVAREKKLEVTITPEYLMENTEEQVSRTLEVFWEKLRNIDENNIEEFKTLLSNIELFLRDNKVQEEYKLQLEIFKLAAHKFLEEKSL